MQNEYNEREHQRQVHRVFAEDYSVSWSIYGAVEPSQDVKEYWTVQVWDGGLPQHIIIYQMEHTGPKFARRAL